MRVRRKGVFFSPLHLVKSQRSLSEMSDRLFSHSRSTADAVVPRFLRMSDSCGTMEVFVRGARMGANRKDIRAGTTRGQKSPQSCFSVCVFQAARQPGRQAAVKFHRQH